MSWLEATLDVVRLGLEAWAAIKEDKQETRSAQVAMLHEALDAINRRDRAGYVRTMSRLRQLRVAPGERAPG